MTTLGRSNTEQRIASQVHEGFRNNRQRARNIHSTANLYVFTSRQYSKYYAGIATDDSTSHGDRHETTPIDVVGAAASHGGALVGLVSRDSRNEQFGSAQRVAIRVRSSHDGMQKGSRNFRQ
eukprot:scaffold5364_cov164-Amphora_coffeaeformis.AAC.31